MQPIKWQYDGPFFVSKGATAEQKQLEAQQAAFYSQLTSLFQQQFSKQSQILDFLKTAMEPLISNPQGFTPAEKAAMQTQASQQNTADFQNAQRLLQQRAFALGDRTIPQGATSQGLASIAAAGAANEANAQQQITLADANLARTNFFNAASVLGGNAAMLNPLGYANSATDAGQAAFNSATTIQQENSSNFLNSLLGGLSGMGVSAITGGITGGLSALKIPGA